MASTGEGFWSNNPCVTTWLQRTQAWWNEEPIRLLRTQPGWTITAVPVLGCTLRRAIKEDALAIAEFWGRYYTNSRRTMCAVPIAHIQSNIETGQWEVYIVVQNATGILLGTVVRRWLTSRLCVKGVIFPKSAVVDFFCTNPGFRKRGIGRWLLATLQNTGPAPLPPHLILWEGVQFSVPPTVAALYWHRRTAAQGMQQGETQQITGQKAKEAWDTLSRGRDIFTMWPVVTPTEVSLWSSPFGPVAIWNTFHWSLPDNQRIGIVIGAANPTAVNAVADAKGVPFGILVAPGEFVDGDVWSYDSPFQWMTYNLLTPFCSNQFPLLAL
jgi:GNAT superfamily N-acetyltransferase